MGQIASSDNDETELEDTVMDAPVIEPPVNIRRRRAHTSLQPDAQNPDSQDQPNPDSRDPCVHVADDPMAEVEQIVMRSFVNDFLEMQDLEELFLNSDIANGRF